MTNVATLAKRELSALFLSPIGHIVLTIYLGFMGFLFTIYVFVPGQTADMRIMFSVAHLALIFIVPLMTMGLLADEYNSGRIEMLRTSPVTEAEILLGKFLGAFGFYVILVASTLVYVALLSIYGKPDFGSVYAGYIGLILMGALFVSVGLFFSACTRYQIVAAMSSMITLALLGILLELASRYFAVFVSVANPFMRFVREALRYMAVTPHMEDFAKGIVDTRDVAYFGTGTLFFLLLTYLILESRKWR